MVTVKSGVEVLPSTSIFSSTPPNLPVEDSMPLIPLNTPRSALSKVYSAANGVCPGSSGLHGPKVPLVSISPGGMALVSCARELGGTVEADRMHHQMVNREHVGIFVRRLGQQSKFRVVRNDFSDQTLEDSCAFGQFCDPRSPLGGICMTNPLSVTWSTLHGFQGSPRMPASAENSRIEMRGGISVRPS